MKRSTTSYWGPVSLLIVGGILLTRSVLLTFTQGVDTPLAAFADPSILDHGRIPLSALDAGPKGYLLTGLVISFVSLAGTLISLGAAAVVFSRRGFVIDLQRWLTAASVFLGAWLVGKFVQHMGNNYAAQTLDVAGGWDSQWPINDETFLFWYLFMAALSLLSFYLGRGQIIQEEQEDLV